MPSTRLLGASSPGRGRVRSTTPLGTTASLIALGERHLEFRDSIAGKRGEFELLPTRMTAPGGREAGDAGKEGVGEGEEEGKRGRGEGKTCTTIYLTDLFSFQT